jgi:gliding motility-associated-like protein
VEVAIVADQNAICEGETVVFTATPVNGGSNPIYAWYVNGVVVPGQTAETYSYGPADGDVVYAMLTSDLDCAIDNPAESNEVTIEILPQNLAPNAVDDVATTVHGIPVDIPVLDNDTDADGTLDVNTLTVIVDPIHGTWLVNDDYTITYIPDAGYVGTDQFTYRIFDDGIPCGALSDQAVVTITILEPNRAPIATDDFFVNGCYTIFGDLLNNDSDPDGDALQISTTPVLEAQHGTVTLYEDGTFQYEFVRGTAFTDSFSYRVCDVNLFSLCDEAMVYITIFEDSDCDGVPNEIDIDKDNDGIVDWVEGDDTVDTDGDGIPDYLDIDADNDGIPDNIEAQSTGGYIAPWGVDNNNNGLDDAYEQGGRLGITPVDTDGDGAPDFQDTDSDNDGVPDAIEGYDTGAKGIAEISPEYSDIDGDGLDDAYDNFFGSFDNDNLDNPFGANPHLQDFDGDGIPDWRDTDDDADGIPTLYEDYNNNDIYFDDDMDNDGHPDYLDIQGDCTMFIPEGFSPNGDGIHDFFQIYCIDSYPNATLLIFDRWGKKLYEHEKYGNLDFWGSFEKAWWDGSRTNEGSASLDRLPAGNYLYVLVRGDGNRDSGAVMLSY